MRQFLFLVLGLVLISKIALADAIETKQPDTLAAKVEPTPNKPEDIVITLQADELRAAELKKFHPYVDIEMGSGLFMGPAKLGQYRVGYIKDYFGFSLGYSSLQGNWGAFEIPNCNCESPSVSEDENGQLPVEINRADPMSMKTYSLGMHMMSEFVKMGNWNLWTQLDLSKGELNIPSVSKKIGMQKLGLEIGWIYNFLGPSNLKFKWGFSHHAAEIKGTLQYATKGHHFFMQTTQVVGGMFYFF